MRRGAESIVWFFIITAAAILLIKYEPVLTGKVVFEGASQKVWDFSNASEYIYDPSVNISGIATLIPKKSIAYANSTNVFQYLPIAAWHPQDVTEDLVERDNKKLHLQEGKMLDVFADENSIVTLYLSGDAGIVYICRNGLRCEYPGLGAVYYNGTEGYYNITANESLSGFSINAENVFVNHVIGLEKAVYAQNERLSKISSLDGTLQEINKDKQFNIVFPLMLQPMDVISIYVHSGTDFYLCDYGTFCEAPGLGMAEHDSPGWYNITINSAADSFNLDPENLKIDQIIAYHTEVNETSYENVTYPETGILQTNPIGAETVHEFQANFEGNVTFLFSDDGINWLDNYENLTTILVKAILHSNGTSSPIIRNMAMTYTASCNWTNKTCLSNNTMLYEDLNECRTSYPQTYCDYCTPELLEVNGVCSAANTLTLSYNDTNYCFNQTGMDEDKVPVNQIVACSYCSINNCTTSDIVSIVNGSASHRGVEAKSTESGNVTIITYDFNPVSSGGIKFAFIESNSSITKIYFENSGEIYYYDSGWHKLETLQENGRIYTLTNKKGLYGVFEAAANSAAVNSAGYGAKSAPVTKPEALPMAESLPVVESNAVPGESKPCDLNMGLSLPPKFDINADSVEATLANEGDCDIPQIELYASDSIRDYLNLSNHELANLSKGENLTVTFAKKGGNVYQITGMAIGDYAVSKIAGHVSAVAVSANESIVREVPLEMEIYDVKPIMNIGLSMIIISLIVLVYVAYHVRK